MVEIVHCYICDVDIREEGVLSSGKDKLPPEVEIHRDTNEHKKRQQNLKDSINKVPEGGESVVDKWERFSKLESFTPAASTEIALEEVIRNASSPSSQVRTSVDWPRLQSSDAKAREYFLRSRGEWDRFAKSCYAPRKRCGTGKTYSLVEWVAERGWEDKESDQSKSFTEFRQGAE